MQILKNSFSADVGLKRTFALSAIAAGKFSINNLPHLKYNLNDRDIEIGVFVSVDYPLVDHHRCRGYYYRNKPQDQWSWKVNLVWTLAFVVSIWLTTVAAFFLESSVPVPKVYYGLAYKQDIKKVFEML